MGGPVVDQVWGGRGRSCQGWGGNSNGVDRKGGEGCGPKGGYPNPEEVGVRRVGGVGVRRVQPKEKVGPRTVGGPNFAFCFPSPATVFILLWNLVV